MNLQIPAHVPVRVTAPDGVSVSAQSWDPPAGTARGADFLFIHGFSQSHLAWLRQAQGTLARRHRLVTYDLRGHGDSDKPDDPAFYREPRRWADEVHSVITQTGLKRPIVVAWSYSGRILLDYVRAYGDSALGGIVMANATSRADPTVLGPGAAHLVGMCSDDPRTALESTQALLRACVAQPLPADEFEFMLGYNLKVPPAIRRHLRRPADDYHEVLESIRVPVLVIRGNLDPINLPPMDDYTCRHVAHARRIEYAGAAHMPFWEESARFDADVDAFARECESA